MKGSNRIAFATVGILLLSLSWYIFFFRTEKNKISNLKRQIDQVLVKIKSTTVSEKELLAAARELNSLKKEMQETESKIIPKNQIALIANGIAQRGQQFDLKFVSIVPEFDALFSRQNEKGPLIKLPVTFRLQGRYLNFGRFLETVDQLPFILSIEEIEAHYDPGHYPLLNIQMRGFVFLRE